MSEDSTTIRHDAAQQRFVLDKGGQEAGVVDYEEDGDTWVLAHTNVDPAFEGQGLGSRIARAALDGARENGKKVRPDCPFIASYVQKHDDWNDILV